MKKKMKMWGCLALGLCLLAGCASQKQIAYLQDVPEDYRRQMGQDYDIRINTDDLLSIMVNSKNPELAQKLPDHEHRIHGWAIQDIGLPGGQGGGNRLPAIGQNKGAGVNPLRTGGTAETGTDRKGPGERSGHYHPIPQLQSGGNGRSGAAGNI